MTTATKKKGKKAKEKTVESETTATKKKSKKVEKKIVKSDGERAKAKPLNLSLAQFRVLKALGSKNKEMTYKDIQNSTGYYSILTAVLKSDHKDSLCNKKLVAESVYETDKGGNTPIYFKITKAGTDLLKKT